VHNTHLTGDLKRIAEEVGAWAQGQPAIVSLWLFGSRERRDSADLDIAFAIDALPSVAARDAFEAMRATWTSDLSQAIGLEVHFEPIATDRIQEAVSDHGVLVYARAGLPDSEGATR
jgi:hypothetical protein